MFNMIYLFGTEINFKAFFFEKNYQVINVYKL